MNTSEFPILQAEIEDAAEILDLQLRAYRSEAEIHDDYSIPPLHQSLAEVQAEFETRTFLKVVCGNQIIGSVRAHQQDGTCYIGKLIVEPAYQDQGLGTRLMGEIEARFSTARRYELFTGYKNEKNLYLYSKLGYRSFKKEMISPKLSLVYLEKRG